VAFSSNVHIDTRMTFGVEANFSSVPGSSLKLSGANLEILGTDAARLAGLANVALVVEGGPQWSTLEAASRDLGNGSAAFDGNFLIGTLQVGADLPGRLRLVDTASNSAASGLPGAVYVDRLIVAAGSTIDLGGLNLYYRSAEIAGDVLESGGGMFAVVPEPSACLLLALGAICLRLRNGRRAY
jgi:hypothetical protein